MKRLYNSPEICDLKQSRLGKLQCLSYFEIRDRPVKTKPIFIRSVAVCKRSRP